MLQPAWICGVFIGKHVTYVLCKYGNADLSQLLENCTSVILMLVKDLFEICSIFFSILTCVNVTVEHILKCDLSEHCLHRFSKGS